MRPGRATSTIEVGHLTRVEGEGSLTLRVANGAVVEARLGIFEAPRYFERLVVGRTPDEVIDIVARICGICPVAYQMSAVHAFELIVGVQVDPHIRALRRLFYCGEWIESHALHIYMLHAPDFLGYPSVIELARDHREVVERALLLKRTGNKLVAHARRTADPPAHRARGRLHAGPAEGRVGRSAAGARRSTRDRPGDGRLHRRPLGAGLRSRAAPRLAAPSRASTR